MLDSLPGLQIKSLLATTSAANFRPTSWPPSPDFPVVIDKDGIVVSRYRDASWNLAPWAGKALNINFTGRATNKRSPTISPHNAELFRQVAAWWIWGPDAVSTATALATRHDALKHIFAECSEAGIVASNLSRFPKVIESIASRLPPVTANRTFGFLHGLYEARQELAFELLDSAGLKQLSMLLPQHESVQTAYIPPRIWSYQVLRLRECLDDYLAHRSQIEACFRFCLKAYRHNAGSWDRLFSGALDPSHIPFSAFHQADNVDKHGRRYHGRFRLTAEHFGINSVLDRWVKFSDKIGIVALSNYLLLISQVGFAYVLNFSLMRAQEGMQLRAGCHSVERDTLGDDIHLLGDIHTLSGVTTKTVHDDDARWIVSPSVESAIEAMTSVTKLRMEAAEHNPHVKLSRSDRETPLLQARQHEPWTGSPSKSSSVIKRYRPYKEIIETYPKLFDLDQLRITPQDLSLAEAMTFGLEKERFSVGQVWPLAWHQLRRTGACNMLSTGLVSEGSLQYQLKHATRAMSRYYGQNHYKLKARLDDDSKGCYLREMYQSITYEFQLLQEDRYISPHGQKRKSQILSTITAKDHKALIRDAEQGRLSYRETFLGGCAKPGAACPLGGISNITGCMGYGGEKACEWAVLDKAKRPGIIKLADIFRVQIKQAPQGSPLHASLHASIESAERAIHAIDAD